MKKTLATLLAASMMLVMAPAFASSAANTIKVDGKLDDWAGVRSVNVVGSGDHEGKGATWYGVMAEDGLYLAVEASHGVYKTTENDWWQNTNFEVFVGRNNVQAWVSARGMTEENTAPAKSDNVTEAAMVTTGSEGSYKSVSELFIAKDKLPENAIMPDGSINVGFAWKTPGDPCNNGGNDGGNATDWWGPTGAATNYGERGNVCRVYSDGVYLKAIANDSAEIFAAKSEWYYVTGSTADGVAPTAPKGWPASIDKDAMSTVAAPFGNRIEGSANPWGTGDNPSDGTQEKAYLWLAKEFNVEDLDAYKGKGLFASMFFDDDINVYINGTLVYSHYQWNGGYDEILLTNDAASVLKEGTNVIAVSLHQHHGGYEFDMALSSATIKEVKADEPAQPKPPVTPTGDTAVYAVALAVATIALGAVVVSKKRRIAE